MATLQEIEEVPESPPEQLAKGDLPMREEYQRSRKLVVRPKEAVVAVLHVLVLALSLCAHPPLETTTDRMLP